MSRSSPRSNPRRRPSSRSTAGPGAGRRAQAEPTAALAAVFAVVLGLGAYAVVFVDAAPGTAERSLAPPTADRVHDRLVTGGVADPGYLGNVTAAAVPDGYRVNATLTAAERTWAVGPTPPATAGDDRASRSVAVRIGPGRVRVGDLRVVVWS